MYNAIKYLNEWVDLKHTREATNWLINPKSLPSALDFWCASYDNGYDGWTVEIIGFGLQRTKRKKKMKI